MQLYFEYITETLLLQSYAMFFSISFVTCLVIILSSGYAFNRRAASDETAIQSAHTGFIPRVGGIAIYLSIFLWVPLLTFGFIPLSIVFDIDVYRVTWLILTAFPVFVVGTAEDLGYPMAPKVRLFASAISSLCVLFILKVWVSRIGIPLIDDLLIFAPLGVIFTVFATVGVVNAFNLIDGVNGLSSYIAITTAVSLSIISFEVFNIEITIFLVLLSASTLGFMILNFPIGKIFLGDGGAYLLGHLLVWSAISLVNYNSSISPFAILLIFFWPVADTGLAIWRRWSLGTPADRPDRLHFHQMVMRFLEIRFFGRGNRNYSNPSATIILIPFISVPQILGIVFWDDFIATIFSTLFVSFLFVATYLVGINLAKKSRFIGL